MLRVRIPVRRSEGFASAAVLANTDALVSAIAVAVRNNTKNIVKKEKQSAKSITTNLNVLTISADGRILLSESQRACRCAGCAPKNRVRRHRKSSRKATMTGGSSK